MVYPVSCTAGCCVTVITLFIKKVGVVRPNLGGPGLPDLPVVAPLVSVCVCVCPRPYAHTIVQIRMKLGEVMGMSPSCALLGGFAIGARVALLWQHNANPSYKLASIPRYDDIA